MEVFILMEDFSDSDYPVILEVCASQEIAESIKSIKVKNELIKRPWRSKKELDSIFRIYKWPVVNSLVEGF